MRTPQLWQSRYLHTTLVRSITFRLPLIFLNAKLWCGQSVNRRTRAQLPRVLPEQFRQGRWLSTYPTPSCALVGRFTQREKGTRRRQHPRPAPFPHERRRKPHVRRNLAQSLRLRCSIGRPFRWPRRRADTSLSAIRSTWSLYPPSAPQHGTIDISRTPLIRGSGAHVHLPQERVVSHACSAFTTHSTPAS